MLKHRVLLMQDTVLFPDDLEARLPPLIRERYEIIASSFGFSPEEKEKRIIAWEAQHPMLNLDSFKTFRIACGILGFVTVDEWQGEPGTYYKALMKECGTNGRPDWGDTAGKVAKLVSPAALDYLEKQSEYYNDYHYRLTNGHEKTLYIVSTRERPGVETLLALCHHMFVDNLLIYENGGDCTSPRNTLKILKNHTGQRFRRSDYVFVTADYPSQAWKEAGIRQIVVKEGVAAHSIENVHIVGSLSEVLTLTTGIGRKSGLHVKTDGFIRPKFVHS